LQVLEATSASRRYIADRATELAAAQVLVPSALSASSASSNVGNVVTTVPWSYAGATGPQAWGQLHPSFATCASGQRQSPIALAKPPEKTGPTAFLPLGNQVFTGVLEHTGHSLELEVQGLSTLTLRGMEWDLQRVQTRYPAEERIGPAEGVVMAVDLLYRAPTSQWAVVSVPLRLGATNPFLAQLWVHLPLHAGERVPLSPGELQLYDLLPAQRHYYQYLGSLTTPPCTEGVLRLVLQTPGTVAPDQLQRLMALLPPHARPPQPLYGRQVLVGP
jgi:carbonic anhydrase